MGRAIKSGVALMSLCALVVTPGLLQGASPDAAGLPSLPAQAQNPGPRITLADDERAGADATKHIVVVFMQNNSFNKLFGTWDQVNGDPVDNIAKASPRTPSRSARTARRWAVCLSTMSTCSPEVSPVRRRAPARRRAPPTSQCSPTPLPAELRSAARRGHLPATGNRRFAGLLRAGARRGRCRRRLTRAQAGVAPAIWCTASTRSNINSTTGR